MKDWDGADITLPEIRVGLDHEPVSRICLSILFHPDHNRIGELAHLDLHDQENPTSLSRHSPGFASVSPGNPASGLDDPYISRDALSFELVSSGLLVRLGSGSSSVALDGLRMEQDLELPLARLLKGVVIVLAGRVVLLLHQRVGEESGQATHNLVGQSNAINSLRASITRAAHSGRPVLLLGETGTGKELVAEALHAMSDRAAGPLVKVNMAAIPAELASSELFGSRKGAYTGAERDQAGYFKQASGGSLFLDEIGDCPRSVQPVLLRALQQGELQLPGADTVSVDVRVIAATDAELDVRRGSFSSALRHRLAGFEIFVPPLRERIEDLGLLMRHAAPTMIPPDPGPVEVTHWAKLVQELALYHWPGNVRELFNVCGQLMAGTSPVDVSTKLRASAGEPSNIAEENVRMYSSSPDHSDQDIERAMLEARWEVSQAARKLAISRQALYRRIERIPGLRVAADIPRNEIEASYEECGGMLRRAAEVLQVSRNGLARRWRALELEPEDF